MVNLEDAIVARLETHGETFEILLDPKVMDFIKQGKEVDLIDYMAVEDIFNNARKGTRPAEDKLKEAFGTDDIGEIARKIVEKGEIHITAEQRKEMLEAKKQQVIAFIAANAINPQTHTPHPPLRIQLALEEAKFHVDPFKPLQKEIDEAMKLLRPLLPIRFEKARIAVKLNGADFGRCYDDIIHYGIVEREEWTPDGSWIGVMEVPGGLTNEIADKLKHKTKGTASVKLIN
jgi:ribosome maturation protein SDO1